MHKKTKTELPQTMGGTLNNRSTTTEAPLNRGSFLLFMFPVCHAFLSVHWSLVVTCRERPDLLARLYGKFSCVNVTFPCGVLGQVWYLIASISDLCLLTYFAFLLRLSSLESD